MTITSLIILVLVAALLFWIISLIPLPANPPFLRNILYILVALLCIAWLLDMGSIVDLGVHRRLR